MKMPLQNTFKKLTLTQQIMVLILMMVVFLMLFFSFFLSGNINETISQQIYTTLEEKQKPIVSALEVGKSPVHDRELFGYLTIDRKISTAVVTKQGADIVCASDIHNPPKGMIVDGVITEAREMLEQDRPTEQKEVSFNSHMYYCRFTPITVEGMDAVLVSYTDDAYAQQLRSTLMDSTIYVIVIVFFMLLIILLLWVFQIIRPLNQIKSYIAQIKEGKDVDLYICRDDEIGDVAKELQTLTAELAKQEKAKEEMIHNISHDLKTPIATIKSYSESIKDGIYPYGDLESSVDVILDNAKRLEDKVHSLLYMNRVEYLVSSDSEGVTTNMKDVVEEVVLNAKVIRPEIQLITDVEEVYFDGLFESWRVCIENILQNAFRYAKTYIKIEVNENELCISNDGPKMDESRIDSLFKPFIMGEGGKFGLGLSIVSKVVAANEYKVQGMNTEDGVAFRIYREVEEKKPSKRAKAINVAHWNNSRKMRDSIKENKQEENIDPECKHMHKR